MVKEAELHKEEDSKRKELIEVRNRLDGLVYSVEKTLKDSADKIESSDKMTAEEKIADAKKAIESDDIDKIKQVTEELEKLSHSIAETIYKRTAQAQGAGPSETGQEQAAGQAPADENVVEAEYEEVKDKNKNQ